MYLLNAEGYTGYGVDLRARKSWDVYQPRPDLRTAALNPPEICLSDEPYFPRDSFLIGNHADEVSINSAIVCLRLITQADTFGCYRCLQLTPWVPLLAAATPGAAFLNIPCCHHELSGRFTVTSYSLSSDLLDSLPANDLPAEQPTQRRLLAPFYAPTPDSTLHGGRVFAYQLYLAELTLRAGFVPERECLRMPSTKNVGFLGRRRVWEGASGGDGEERARVGLERVREEVRGLVEGLRGEWVARVPEGKAGGH